MISSDTQQYQGLLCAVCQEYGDSKDITTVTCGDLYCRSCLQALFERAFADEANFPPRCCGQAISLDPEFLTGEILLQHREKKIEFETVDRTYCSAKVCSSFLHREHMKGDCATCPRCNTKTCTICKAAWHTGDCPADTDLQLLLETGK